MQPLDGDVLLLLLFACTVGVITLLLLVQAYMVCFLNRVPPRGTMEAPAVEGAAGDGCGGVDVSASWASLPGASCGWVGDEEAGDCVVCLSALGEEGVGGGVRVLPRCRHAFHAWCIGRWLVSHSVCCPICRTPARAPAPPPAPAEVVTTSPPRPPPPPPPPLSAAAAVRVDAETPGAVGGAVVGYFARRGAMVLGEHQITEELHLPLLLLY